MRPEIITGIFTLVGVIVGSVIGYFITLRVIKRQEFYKLANKLRLALINHSRIIKRIDLIETRADNLDVAFTNTETAFIEFRSLLCNRQRESINAIWDLYNNKNKTYKDIVKFHADDILNSMNKSKLRENLLINIEKLREFTKPK